MKDNLQKGQCIELEELKHIVEQQKAKICHLNTIIENLPGSIYWKDKQGIYQGCNVYAAEKMKVLYLETSNTKESVVGKTDYDFFPKDVADEYRQHDLEIMQTGQELVKEETVKLPNGEALIQVSSKKPLRDEKNNIIGVIGNTIDINRLEKIEHLKDEIEQLKSDNFQLRSIIENLPGSIYWKNKQGVYQGRNRTSAESLRAMNFPWRLEDIVGKTDYDLFPKEMADGFRKHDLEAMESGEELVREEITTLPSGKKLIQLSSKRQLYDKKGDVIGIIGNTVDITNLKKIEAELREAKELLEVANKGEIELRQAVTVLAGSIVHDLRTPIAIIEMRGNSTKDLFPILFDAYRRAEAANLPLLEQLSKSQLLSLEQAWESICEISREMNGFIDITLNTLSKALKQELSKQDLSLCSMWHCINSTLARYPFSKEQRQWVKWDQQDFDFMGNEILMIRVFSNLLSNALQQITQNKHGKIFICTEKTDHANIIHFKDTAGGASPEIISHLFEGYHTTKERGTGVGLAFCRLIMRNFGGDIVCQSVEGDYIEFDLVFPQLSIQQSGAE